MTPSSLSAPVRAHRWLAALAGLLTLAAAGGCSGGSSSSAPPAPAPSGTVSLIQTADLAARLGVAQGENPLLLQVGFRALYRAGAIPGSRYAGPASRPEGLAALRHALEGVPRDRSIVLYCGCCPWDHCPNVRPAFQVAHGMGFTDVRVLYVAKDLDSDWVGRGFPVEKPAD
jgi:hypothetical protein